MNNTRSEPGRPDHGSFPGTQLLLRAAAVAVVIMASSACDDDPMTVSAQGAPEGVAIQASVSGSPGDIAAMQEIVNTLDQNWAVDAATYAAVYDGAEWIGPTGLILTNGAAIAGVYTGLFANVFPGTTRHSTIRDLTFLTGTTAILDIDARVTGFTSLPPFVVPWQAGIVRALEKSILVKRGGQWSIVKHQQTAVAPGVP
jgi:hypothetical protein